MARCLSPLQKQVTVPTLHTTTAEGPVFPQRAKTIIIHPAVGSCSIQASQCYAKKIKIKGFVVVQPVDTAPVLCILLLGVLKAFIIMCLEGGPP